MFTMSGGIWTFLVLVSFALLGQSTAQSQTQAYDKLSYYYYSKCYNLTGDRNVFQKLYSDVMELQTFVNYTFNFIPKEKKTFCTDHRKAIEGRLIEINNDIKPCMPGKERFIGDFIEESFKEFLHFLCHNDAENIERLFSNDIKAKTCRDALRGGGTKEMSQCFSRIFKPSGEFLQKKEVCDDLSTAQKCFTQVLEARCTGYSNYISLNEQFFSYIRKPCGACAGTFVNSLLLLASCMVTYFKLF